MADHFEETVDLQGSMDPALLPDITTTYEHMQRSDGTVGLVEKANSGRMSPVRKRSVKDVEQQIEALEKENFDLKLRIYFLEQQKGINKDDTLKVNIDLRVQLQSIHQEFQKKQETWEQMMAGYENHIEELELRINKDRSTEIVKEVEGLRHSLADTQQSLHEMEQLLNDKAFESETQLQAAHSEIDKLRGQLADRERQLVTSPSQEEMLALKHCLDGKGAELDDRTLLLNTVTQQVKELENQVKQVAAKLALTSQGLLEREAEVNDKDVELNEKEQQLHAVRDELTQKDFSLRKAQIDLQALSTASVGKEAEIEKFKAEIAEEFSVESQSILAELQTVQQKLSQKDAVLLSKDKEFSALRRHVDERDKTITNMNDEINRQKQQIMALNNSVAELKAGLQEKDRQLLDAQKHLQLNEEKYNKDLCNLDQQLSQVQNSINSRDQEIEKLRLRVGQQKSGQSDTLNQLRSALHEKDQAIASLVERCQQREALIGQLQEEATQDKEDQPDCTSTPREDTNPAIIHLCVEVERLKKENAALMESRPVDYSDEDLDIDALSDTSDTRDYLHTQLAKNNARSQALQGKLLEMSREEIDGGSETSSLLKEQVSALMRMRDSDQRVIDALKKHISVNSGTDFDPEVINNLASDVHKLSAKVRDLQKKGRKSHRSQSSRSHRSDASSANSSVYREEIDHLKKELDMTRHEASKARAELHRLGDESAVVSKLQSTEALVRQQAEEKKQLIAELEYYKNLLEKAGLLPKSPRVHKGSSVGNLDYTAGSGDKDGSHRRTSRIPRRSSSTPRLSTRESSSEGRIRGQRNTGDDECELQEHVEGMIFRQRLVTPGKIRDAMQKMGERSSSEHSHIPVVSQSAPSTHSRIPTNDQSAMATQVSPWIQKQQHARAVEAPTPPDSEYGEEIRVYGRPAELKQKIDELCHELDDTQEKLNQSVEYAQQMEHSYQNKLEDKDEYIDDLEEKIRQLEAQLRGFYTDRSGSVTLDLAGSRCPSSLHSVPAERASSRVVSLNDSAPHDRSTSGVAVDRSTLSFSGSTQRPGSISPLENLGKTFGSSMNKSADTGISRDGSVPSSAMSSARSHTAPHSAATVIGEDAGSKADEEISPVVITQLLAAKTLSPLQEVSSAPSPASQVSDYNRDSGLDTSRRSKASDRGTRGPAGERSRSVNSLMDTLDSTTERMRKEHSSRFTEVPSLGGTLIPGDPFPTQENLLNISSDTINKLPMEPHVRSLFAADAATSPEKGRVHTPTSSPHKQGLRSPVKATDNDQAIERYEKQMSPNRQLLDRPEANSWEQAANSAFPNQSPDRLRSLGQPPDRPQSAGVAVGVREQSIRPYSASMVEAGTWADEGVMSERPVSSAGTQTDSEDLAQLSDQLVRALSKEDTLKEQRKHLGELHKQYEEALKASQEENEELRSRLSDADDDVDNQIQKRLETAQLANSLQQELKRKEAELKEAGHSISKLKEKIARSKSELSTSQTELSSTRQELNTANQGIIDSSKKFKNAAKQLREVKDQLYQAEEEHHRSMSRLQETADSLRAQERQTEVAVTEASGAKNQLTQVEEQLHTSQTELRVAKEELANKTNSQVDLTKRLRELESDRDVLTKRLEATRSRPEEQQTTPKAAVVTEEIYYTPVKPLQQRSDLVRRPSSITGLQEELNSILDASQHIKSNIASALEQSRLHDTLPTGIPERHTHSQSLPLSVEQRLPAASAAGDVDQLATFHQPYNTGKLNVSQNNAVERSLGNDTSNPMTYRGDSLAHDISGEQVIAGAPELVTINGVTYQQVPPPSVLQQPAASVHRPQYQQLPTVSMDYQQTPVARDYQQAPATRGYQQQGVATSGYEQAPVTGSYQQAPVTGSYQQAPVTGSYQQAPVTGSYQQAPVTGSYQQAPVTGSYQQAPALSTTVSQQSPVNNTGYSRSPDVLSKLPNAQFVPNPMTQNLNSYQYEVGGKQPISSASDLHGFGSGLPYKSGQLGTVTQPPAFTSTPVLDGSTVAPRREASGSAHPPVAPNNKQALESGSGNFLTQQTATVYETLEPVERYPSKLPADGRIPSYYAPAAGGAISHRLPTDSAYMVSPQSSPTSAYLPRPSELYESVLHKDPRLQEHQMSNLPPSDHLPSTRSPLYAISDLINYELLKKQNEESLVILSGLEARIQGRLDRFTTTSPLEDMEWCTLKELKSCAENLRQTLFAEKKHITKFYIRELPDTRGPKYEEMLRAYKKLESRYQWAKAQLTELMKATKLDEDLVAQMKRVKSILRASKENIKSRAYTAENLKQRLV